MDVDTARINGTLGENNLVGKGYLQRGSAGASLFLPRFITLYNLEGRGYLHRGSAGGQDISAALYNTIQSRGGGGLSPQRFSWGQDCKTLYNLVGGGGISTEVQLGTGYFCRGV